LDGKLDEPIYSQVSPISDFVQMEPRAGSPATEKTVAESTTAPITVILNWKPPKP
jgi:hypothetical protein